jgi:type I restriction enzyme R subunit
MFPCECETQLRRKVKIKLADGKERLIQSMSATSFWSPDGKPISARQFVERLYGELPELFKNEDELRKLWGQPDTRKALLQGLEERGYGVEQLRDIGKLVEAENSDIYDVLAYIAYAHPPITREERVVSHRDSIFAGHEYPQQQFLSFVLDQYVSTGVDVLDAERLPQLIELKYHSVADAVAELGPPGGIREVFVGFQQRLY